MSDAHAGIVWNPSKTTESELRAALEATHAGEVSWFETSEDDPGRDATQRALDAGVDLILAAGGDGTIRAVAEHLAETQAETDLGIIPLGTGNLLARNLGVPLNDLTAAFTRAFEGTAQPVDIGWAEILLPAGVQRRAFAVMAGFGIDAHMISETDDDLEDRAGWLAYVESLGRAVSASEVIDIRLGADGGPAEREKAHTLIVGNCGTLQGGITLLPDADPQDGQLDLLVLHADGIAGWIDTMRNLAWDNGLKRLLKPGGEQGQAEGSDSTTHRRLTSLTIELDEPRVFEVDGDNLGDTTRVEISIQPGAVRIR
ncbi:NAD(+)/NADH kinase [Microbacterium sp. KUDC0406]|uniref:diacylglycerol/lipid kinase family protein n=1 Tax=Microbacterium sp. KUDC0406 TaxID=2909588 RepID=UPI001F2E5F2F|nr:diacylglycerol kinase family protein [Microbacterium sp. KUDC0406]UJP09708.1 NAD(+)/NADH kinase [Microbacterium sp. KUDC0406]